MYFQDYKIGQVFDKEIEDVSFTKEEIIASGREFDPRDIHVDEKKAKESRFNTLIAPGSYSNMKFWASWVKTGIDHDGLIAGVSVDKASWLLPVYPDTPYKISVEVVDKKVRKENEDGFVTYKLLAKDPDGKIATEYIATGLVRFRKD